MNDPARDGTGLAWVARLAENAAMRPIRRLALDRRTFLRGSACAVALPWLDAMQPACSRPLAAPRRCVFVFSPNGMNMQHWRPEGLGPETRFGRTLEPLEPLRQRVSVFSGLAIDGGRAHGDGPGDHARSASTFLTCAHPRKTGGADIHVGVSVDQLIAERVGGATAFASLEVGMERGRSAGVCDSGYSCAYSSNISWRSPNTPVAKETDPKAVFARLFGDPDVATDAAAAKVRRQRTRSVLDAVRADARSLSQQLGATDRRKLDDYLQSVRELEQRFAKLDEETPETEIPDGLMDGGRAFGERQLLMYEIIALALATDATRVVTFMLGNAGSNRSYRFLDVPEGHHNLSHHGKDVAKLESIAKINRFQVEQFGAFLQRLARAQSGESDLLSSSLVLFGSGLGDGNRHDHGNLPMLLAGEGGGAARSRGHVVCAEETPMANLYLAVMHAMGRQDEEFADSDGVLKIG